ncbi:PHP domain-containing protein [Natranaerobius thermophilus]|uniref:PHP domain protein n=1 Tax=Natranaerobius thermophilus (strain ATCC BAA-1301 / DSM 18059 / JW/NM-WN-LF) TaxID=457570 RepID=B2A3R8_NATTJ|nr:PHP domain-containing protein [Natranaerobius thermophilus]ACB83694.1 PHP domain protein [Natranaerobius thermophilus JW/NM-WN-LF]
MSKGKWFKADLHIHSVLSPCADLDMGPNNIIDICKRENIEIIAITDHNTGRNVPAFQKKAAREGITVIPGMELQTREEVHCLCYFPSYSNLARFESMIAQTFPQIPNKEDIFGTQLVINDREEILAHEERMLLSSSSLGISELMEKVKQYSGLVIPAHVDKPSYSLLTNLGPPIGNEGFKALEFFSYSNYIKFTNQFSNLKDYPIIMSSDAHDLQDFQKPEYKTYFLLEEPVLSGIQKALESQGFREVILN